MEEDTDPSTSVELYCRSYALRFYQVIVRDNRTFFLAGNGYSGSYKDIKYRRVTQKDGISSHTRSSTVGVLRPIKRRGAILSRVLHM